MAFVVAALLLTNTGVSGAVDPQALPRSPLPKGDFTSWIVPDDYPTRSGKSESGVVTVRLFVGKDGRATGCKILISSGHSLVDQRTCAALTLRARFEPALDSNGAPIAGAWTVRKFWHAPTLAVPSQAMLPQQIVPLAAPEMIEVRFKPSQSVRPSSSPAYWIIGDDPQLSHVSGVIEYQLAVDQNGKPKTCTVRRYSGVPKLDAATCNSLIRRARFYPATNAEAEPIDGQWSGEVRWIVPDQDNPAKPD